MRSSFEIINFLRGKLIFLRNMRIFKKKIAMNIRKFIFQNLMSSTLLRLRKITKVAKANKRSLNAQLEFLAENCVAEYEKEHGEIELSEDELYSK